MWKSDSIQKIFSPHKRVWILGFMGAFYTERGKKWALHYFSL
jgi:hypothetical protein